MIPPRQIGTGLTMTANYPLENYDNNPRQSSIKALTLKLVYDEGSSHAHYIQVREQHPLQILWNLPEKSSHHAHLFSAAY